MEIVWWKCYVHAGVCRCVFKAGLMLAKNLEGFYTHSTLLFQRFYEEPCHFCVAHADFWNITYARRTMPFLSSTKSLSCLICSYLLVLYLHQQCQTSTARRFFGDICDVGISVFWPRSCSRKAYGSRRRVPGTWTSLLCLRVMSIAWALPPMIFLRVFEWFLIIHPIYPVCKGQSDHVEYIRSFWDTFKDML